MSGAVQTLFVDEAGQTSLANAVAVASAAPALVLLGDPQQLDQPTKGVHPPGAGASALGHVVGGDKTIADERGVFLGRTWRLHPDLCAATSELFYDGRLTSRPGLERQRLEVPGPLGGTGFRMVYVPHQGNQNTSPEEVEKVREIYAQLTADGAALPDGAKVGTVEKFQGQEAPEVIYSLASSSAEDAPRGMSFCTT
jgi:superfamily I DNA and/or RNA helicase